VGAAKPKVDLPQPGETLAGKYAIVRVIGEGGMGVVFEANHLRMRQRVAIKVLMPRFVEMPDLVGRFEREGRMAAQLRGRHIAQVLDVDVTPTGLPYMVMEYLEGRDLDVELTERGPLPIAEAVDYVLQACEAMTEAHALGIVHRDLKPANLFVCPGPKGPVIKVLDFGISKSAGDDDARLTGTHATVGTPLYMSPEQVRSAKNVDLRTDIWSLGVILFELLTGRPPFVGSTTGAAASIVIDAPPGVRELRAEVPPALEAHILRALEKDPARRFPDVQSFAEAIGHLADGYSQPSLAPPSGAPSSGGHARPWNADSVLAGADTLSYDHAAGSSPAATAPRPGAPATSPGWTSAPASHPRRRALVMLLAIPVLAAAIAALSLRPWTTSAPPTASSGPPSASSPPSSTVAAAAAAAAPPAPSTSAETTEPPASATPPTVPSAAAATRPPRPVAPGRKHEPPRQPSGQPATAAPASGRPLFLP
jgi:serine/threonine-protein kinase